MQPQTSEMASCCESVVNSFLILLYILSLRWRIYFTHNEPLRNGQNGESRREAGLLKRLLRSDSRPDPRSARGAVFIPYEPAFLSPKGQHLLSEPDSFQAVSIWPRPYCWVPLPATRSLFTHMTSTTYNYSTWEPKRACLCVCVVGGSGTTSQHKEVFGWWPWLSD